MSSKVLRAARYDAIVIGAGHNGLTTAALLAKAGRKVLVLERRNIVGGLAVGEEFHPGCRALGLLHDTAGIRPGVVDALGLHGHGLELTEAPPAVFAPQVEGRGLLLHHDPGRAATEIEAFSSRDANRYAEYRAFLARIGRFSLRLFDQPPPRVNADGLGGLLSVVPHGVALRRLGRKDMMDVLRMAPMCVADWLNEWFGTELLKSLLAGPAVYGTFMGPWSPGSSANLLRWEALAGRAVRGGPQSLIDALEAAARAQGVEIRTMAEVQRIRISAGKVQGVTLCGGESIDAACLAASCDPRRTFLHLIAGRDLAPKLGRAIQHYRCRGTTAQVNLLLSAPLRFACRPDLRVEYARIGETLERMERAFDAVKYGRFGETPILDICVGAGAPSPVGVGDRPEPSGRYVVSILAHFAPYDLTGGWNDEQRERLGDVVLGVLVRYAPSVADTILAREVLTPVDIEQRYGLTGGHIHHGEHALDQILVRPCPQCARYQTPIEGLFLCGSGSHPGGGLTCAPGALAASAILQCTR